MSSIGVPLSAAQNPRQFMTAVLDAILGYWRLFNLGVLHRDISEGNVMMLDEKQAFKPQEPKEPRDEDPDAKDDILVESEKKLQEILAQIKRPPSGMLSDFDLHAIHSATTPFSISINSTDSTHAASRTHPSVSSQSKRLKTNSSTHIPAPSNDSRAKVAQGSRPTSIVDPKPTAQAEYENKPIIDFRTGTTAFMSVRVLEVAPGVPYRHTFLDDLESFFWVIIWSVAAHLDQGKHQPTWAAQFMLNSMNQDSMQGLADWKNGILANCFCANGASILRRLDSFENSWASDDVFADVILGLGKFFFEVILNPDATRLPADIFTQIVGTIQRALSSKPEPESCS